MATINGTNNNDNLTGTTLSDLMYGLAGDDYLYGNAGNDTLDGGIGNDTLDGGTGADSMIGGAGNDTYYVDDAGDIITENANEGTDNVYSGISYTLNTNVENLSLSGTAAINGTGNTLNNTLVGNSGNNILNGGTGADAMSGGLGNDTYTVDNTSDVVSENANEGTDLIQASVSYTLSNNVENLTLTGAAAVNGTGNTLSNAITGNAANNILDGGAGADTLAGGAGNDTYVVDNTADVVTENANQGTDLVQASVTYTLGNNLENLTLTGTAAVNGTGNTLNNVINGNAANNILDGGTGIDTLTGGAGNDTYVLDNSADVVTENANEGTDLIKASFSYTLGANFENLTLTGTSAINGTGTELNNVITGNSAANTLDGGAGADTLTGGAGNDTYTVDNSSDVAIESVNEGTDLVNSSASFTLGDNLENLTLTGSLATSGAGNALNNTIIGNSADNLINGGLGNDTMTGGAGNDIYVVDNTADVVTENAAQGTDTVVSSVNYTLGNNVENLTLSVTATQAWSYSLYDKTFTAGNTQAFSIEQGTLLKSGQTNALDVNALAQEARNSTAAPDQFGIVFTSTFVAQTAGSYRFYTSSDDGSTLRLQDSNGTWLSMLNQDGITKNYLDNDYLQGTTQRYADVQLAAGQAYTLELRYWELSGGNAFSAAVLLPGSSSAVALDSSSLGVFGTGNNAINGTGNALNNLLIGNSANNQLDGGTGADTLKGGQGDDTYIVDNASDVVVELTNQGTDSVQTGLSYILGANVENLLLTGTAASNGTGNQLNNTITGNSANNILDGGAGVDVIDGGDGNDTIYDGEGYDTVYGGLGDDLIRTSADWEKNYFDGGAGTDTVDYSTFTYSDGRGLYGSLTGVRVDLAAGNARRFPGYYDGVPDTLISIENAIGSTLNDTLIGDAQNNVLTGGIGNDLLSGGTGADSLIGGVGDDTYWVDDTGDLITENANEGTDEVKSSITYTLGTNLENLTLIGSAAINGTGNTVTNVLIGNGANNELRGLAGRDSLSGDLGNDSLYGGTEADVLAGDAGDDYLQGDQGNDYLIGGNGNDTLDEDGTGVLVGYGNDVLDGGAGNDVLSSGDGNDYLIGGSGNDTLNGETGDDILNGGVGSDNLLGGTGNDIYYIDSTGDIVTENLNEGADAVRTSVDYTLTSNVENLNLQAGQMQGRYIMVRKNDAVADYLVLGEIQVLSADGTNLAFQQPVTSSGSYTADLGFQSNLVDGNMGGNYLTDKNYISNTAGNGWIQIDLGSVQAIDSIRIFGRTDYTPQNGNYTVYVASTDISGQTNTTLQANTAVGYFVQGNSTGGLVEFNSNNLTNGTVTAATNLNGTGNTLNNTLTGNSANNTLNGSIGADTLIGGTGNDTYVVDNAGDVITEITGQGTDTVLSAINASTLAANVENLTLSALNMQGRYILINKNDGIADRLSLAEVQVLTDNGTNIALGSAVTSSGSYDTNLHYQTNIVDGVTGGSVTTDKIFASSTMGNGWIQIDLGSVQAFSAINIFGRTDSWSNQNGNYSVYISDTSISGQTNAALQANTSVGMYVVNGVNGAVENISSVNSLGRIGNAANITATGNTLNNVITGNAGNNTLDGSTGDDTLTGSTGDDIYKLDSLLDSVVENLAEGTDQVDLTAAGDFTLFANVENLNRSAAGTFATNGNDLANTIYLNGSSTDTVYGLAGDDNLFGGAGNDYLDGGIGADRLVGGAGNDTYVVDNAGDVITETAGQGSDTVLSAINASALAANVEKLTLSALNMQGRYILINKNDRIADYLSLAEVQVLTDNGTNIALGSAVTSSGSYDTNKHYQTNIVDGVTGGSATTNKIFASSTMGNGWIQIDLGSVQAFSAINIFGRTDGASAQNGNYTVYISDTSISGQTNTALQANTSVGMYVVSGINGAVENIDSVYSLSRIGNAANIIATGNTLNNTITGNDGDNTLDGGTGNDTLTGSTGDDIYKLNSLLDNVVENLDEGLDQADLTAAGDFTLFANVENLNRSAAGTFVTNGNDLSNSIYLNGGSTDTVYGLAGDDNLFGGAGNDYLDGGTGNDLLDGGLGDDAMFGGAGDDTYRIDSTLDSITEYASEGYDSVESSITYTLGSNIEKLALTGTIAINGTGNALDNYITGNSAANSLIGGDGIDTLLGDLGNDTLDGGLGADTLNGGQGNDTYLFGRSYGADRISDFDATAGNTDVLSISAGVTSSQVWFQKVNNDLKVSIIGTNDSETIQNWYSGANYHIEQFKTADGKTLLDTQVQNLVSAMSAFQPPAAGQTTLPANYQTTLNTVIAANWR